MYQETLDFLYSQLPQYQKEGKKAYKDSLENIQAICYLIGNPQDKLKAIHIAGTNGKGSSAHMLASILQTAGYKVGLYTSPHLVDFRERIKINGKPISEKRVIKFVNKYKEMLIDIRPSFFEWTVGLAFHEFNRQKVDIAIIETGLGGRLDSTNIITPLVSVITNIGYDHQNILGNTLKAIAKEKAGIIKDDIPVVVGETHEETASVFKKAARKKKSNIFFADKIKRDALPFTDLKGDYQDKNVATVLTTIDVLKTIGWKIGHKKINKGLLSVVGNTGLQGRWQILQEKPLIILDVAHNKAGIENALTELTSYTYKNLHIVLALSNDKDHEAIFKVLPKTATYYFCNGKNQRLLPAINLRYDAVMFALHGKHYETPMQALLKAKTKAKKKDIILVCGSNFLVGEILETKDILNPSIPQPLNLEEE